MIEYIHGDLTELTPAMAVVETAGVGYGLNISLNTYTAIQGKQEVKLYVHEVLVAGGRDDSFTLSVLLPSRNVNSTVCSSPYRVWVEIRRG